MPKNKYFKKPKYYFFETDLEVLAPSTHSETHLLSRFISKCFCATLALNLCSRRNSLQGPRPNRRRRNRL